MAKNPDGGPSGSADSSAPGAGNGDQQGAAGSERRGPIRAGEVRPAPQGGEARATTPGDSAGPKKTVG